MSERLDPELAKLEAALAGLSPAESRVDRDQVMYSAGVQAARQTTQRNARRSTAIWLSISAALALACLGLASRPNGPGSQRLVHDTEIEQNDASAPQPAPAVDAEVDRKNRFCVDNPSNSYFRLREVVLADDLALLSESWDEPKATTSPSSQATGNRALLNELLGS